MGLGKWGKVRLSSVIVVMASLLGLGGCGAVPLHAVSPLTREGSTPVADMGDTLVATLTPEGANTSGGGSAHLVLNPETQQICSTIHVSGIELPATHTHIHRGAAGVAGPVVVTLTAPNAKGVSSGCTHASHDLIVAIMQHPPDYYVNVHNVPYPDGAVRGQLSVCAAHSGC